MSQKKVLDFALLMILSLIWGSSYLLMKKALIGFNPTMVAVARVLISGTIFLPYLYLVRKKIKLSPARIFHYILVGFTGTAIPSFLFSYAVKHTGSALPGVLNALTPIFTLLISLWLFSYTVTIRKVIGITLAFSGTVFLVYTSQAGDINSKGALPVLFIIGATICYAISSNVVKYRLSDVHPILISGMGFSIAMAPTYLTGSLIEHSSIVEYWKPSLIHVAILAIFATVIASILYFWLVQRTDAFFGSSVSFLIPIIALSLGYLDGEIITWVELSSTSLILFGLYLSQRS